MMTPDIETEDYFGMSPQAVQEIMHKEHKSLIDARNYAQEMMKEAEGEDWSYKAFHYLGAVTILIRAIDEQVR